MAHVDTNRAHIHSGNAHDGIFTRMMNAFIAWNETRVTRNALSRLSDRELEDIGLNRADVDKL
ncbi:MAG: DUF1127 domain-containing protein [Pseudomonadota bacterium]